jgi:hypothetical protein
MAQGEDPEFKPQFNKKIFKKEEWASANARFSVLVHDI